jgi:MiaB/RimO family radical SAM methylthiotransferase
MESGQPRSYVVRTYGCQMNEHDSERIAGLLEADGLVRAESDDDADVVVLNTCCIRENADNKLYGNLGHLKPWKEARDGRQIMVAGCLAQKDRDTVAGKARHVDVVIGTHNVHRAAELLAESRSASAPITEILEAAVIDDQAMFPSALPVRREKSYNAWVTIQIGCDNNCAFCIVPAVRGDEISRPYVDVVDEVRQLAADGVTEVTLLGQNVNSYGRDLQLAARQAGDTEARLRPLFADLLRDVGAVDGIRRVRYTSPHPKDMRPETFSAMAETAAVCEYLHYPLQAGSDRVLSLMHRGYTAERYLERLGQARATIDDHARGRSRGRVRLRIHVHLLAPAGYRGRINGVRFRRSGGGGRTIRAPPARHRTFGAAQAPGTRGRDRRGADRRAVEEAARRDLGSHSPEQVGALHAAPPAAHGVVRHRRDHTWCSASPRRPVRRTGRRADSQAAHSGRCSVSAST